MPTSNNGKQVKVIATMIYQPGSARMALGHGINRASAIATEIYQTGNSQMALGNGGGKATLFAKKNQKKDNKLWFF